MEDNKKEVKNTKKRTFILDGEINESTARNILESIIEINDFDEEQKESNSDYLPKPIKIIVNTYDGVLYDANLIVSVIESSVTPIYTYCYGKAMSAGFFIFSAGHKRFATPLVTFMYHDASCIFRNTLEGVKTNLESQLKLRDRCDDYILRNTKLPKHIMDETKKLKDDWYLTANEAFGYGLVDELIPLRNREVS